MTEISRYYEAWTEYATCRSIGGAVFYPEDASEGWGEAIKVCTTSCTVRLQCLDFAMRSELGRPVAHRFGVFAGLKPYQRRKYEPQWLAEQEERAA